MLLWVDIYGQTEPIPISRTYIIPQVGEQLWVELKSARLDVPYSGNEEIEFFGPDDQPISSTMLALCAFDECINNGTGGVEYNPTVTNGIINGSGNDPFPEVPLVLTPKQNLPYGVYTLVVRESGSQKVIHRRSLKLVHPEPEVTGFTVQYPDGRETKNKIQVDPNKDLNGVKFILDGKNLNYPFKSVSIQGLALKKIPDEPNAFLTDAWTAQRIKSLSLESPKIKMERHLVADIYLSAVRIEAEPPIITGNLVRKINAGQERYLLTLNVSNLFKRARLQLSELGGGNVLKNEGTFDGPKVDVENGTITQEVLFNKGALSAGNGRFSVKVINRDGQESATKVIQMQVREATIVATPINRRSPFIEGAQVQVRFTRSDNSAAFRFRGDVRLVINGTSQVITPRNLDGALNQFSTMVNFPYGLSGFVPFELTSGGNNWRGYFEEIIDRPKLISEPREVYVGSSVLIHLQDPNDKVKAIVRSDMEGIKLTDSDFSDGATELSVDKDVPVNTSFSVGLYYENHQLESIDFTVKSWPNPGKAAEFKIGGKVYGINPKKKVAIDQNEVILLQSKKGLQKKTTSKLTAQLITSDGIKLGTPQPLVYNEKSQRARTTLTPYGFGIKGGDEFMIELVNPLSQPVIQRAYAKRDFWERILANAGVSAVNISFKERRDENNEKLPGTTLISGVNLGVYYMTESLQSAGRRPFGYGINIMAQEENSEVELRLGTSILLYETLSFGFNFMGNGGPAFFIGANVSFLDLSKIFDTGS